MENFTPYTSLAGGILLGISASLLMYLNGRVAGISGIVSGLLNNVSVTEKAWRAAFVIGVIGGAAIYAYFFPVVIEPREHTTTALLVLGGYLLVSERRWAVAVPVAMGYVEFLDSH